jgi:hypothetical protein
MPLSSAIVVGIKANFDDHVITVRNVHLPDGRMLPTGTHGFVISVLTDSAESYEVEFDPEEGDEVLAVVSPDDFGVA